MASALPNNVDGYRTGFTCELCGFEPKTKNKYRERKHHLVMKHFKERIDKEIPASEPFTCPTVGCVYIGVNKQSLLRHSIRQHNLLKLFICDALAEKGIAYSLTDEGRRRKRKYSEPTELQDEKQNSSRLDHSENKTKHLGQLRDIIIPSVSNDWRRHLFGSSEDQQTTRRATSSFFGGQSLSLAENVIPSSGFEFHVGPTSSLGSPAQYNPRQQDLIFSPFGNVLNLTPSGLHDTFSPSYPISRSHDPLNLSTANHQNIIQDETQADVHSGSADPIIEPHFAMVTERDMDFLDVLERQMGLQF